MKFLLSFVVVCLPFCNFVKCRDSYKIAVIPLINNENYIDNFQEIIAKASGENADLLLLPATPNSFENYDELVKSISTSSREGRLYIICHVYESVQCASRHEVVKSSLVFNRSGNVINVQRKPLNSNTKCNVTSDIGVFMTDFGVAFRMVVDDELLLKNLEPVGLTNFIVVGSSDVQLLGGKQFPSSWAYVNNVNVISSAGVFAGRGGWRGAEGANVLVLDVKTNRGPDTFTVPPTSPEDFLSEDLRQYIIKPLNQAASARGYEDTVCHESFCCKFYVKTGTASEEEHGYGIAAFSGFRHIGSHNVHTRVCSVLACAGAYKRSCTLGDQDISNMKFQEISITANFSANTSKYPVVLSSTGVTLSENKFDFTRKSLGNSEEVSVKINDMPNLLAYGILERDYSKDFVSKIDFSDNNCTETSLDLYEYILNGDVFEFFDYLWIRLRILIVVVSIYFLEMM